MFEAFQVFTPQIVHEKISVYSGSFKKKIALVPPFNITVLVSRGIFFLPALNIQTYFPLNMSN